MMLTTSSELKDLFVIRHAKSSWNDFKIKDIDRPLNSRGLKDAYVMAERMKSLNLIPDKILSSNGIRALHTATIFAKNLNFNFKNLVVQPNLYHASSSEIRRVIQELGEEVNTLAIFAHNPGITNFAWQANVEISNVPTCGILHFRLQEKTWSHLDFASLDFVDFDYPKKKI